MSGRRRLAAVVGGDGAGKTTIARLLVDRLNGAGVFARCVDRWDIVGNPAYPAAAFLDRDVPSIRSCVTNMPSRSRYLFLLWTMSLALSGNVEHENDEELVVVDGYWMKHAASEIAYGVPPEWALAVADELPPADIVLRLQVSPEQAWERKRGDVLAYECGLDESCSRESFLRHQSRIVELLTQWSTSYGWTEIDATQPADRVALAAADHVLLHLR